VPLQASCDDAGGPGVDDTVRPESRPVSAPGRYGPDSESKVVGAPMENTNRGHRLDYSPRGSSGWPGWSPGGIGSSGSSWCHFRALGASVGAKLPLENLPARVLDLKIFSSLGILRSGWRDLNSRPLDPQMREGVVLRSIESPQLFAVRSDRFDRVPG
jgi:hypothetical protein